MDKQNRNPAPQRGNNQVRQLTPEEMARRKAMMARRKAETEKRAQAEKEKKKQKRRDIRSQILAVVMILCVVMLLVGVGYLVVKKVLQRRAQDYGEHSFQLEQKVRMEGNVPLLNMTELAERLNLVVIGDSQRMRFILTKQATGSEDTQECVFENQNTHAKVNETEVQLIAPAYITSGQCWVPLDFINAHMQGLSAEMTSSNYPVLKHETAKDDGGVEYEVYLSLSAERLCALPEDATFEVTSTPDPMTEPPTTTAPETTLPPETQDPDLEIINSVTFSQNLSAYESAMNPQGEQRDAYLVLINRESTVDGSYAPTNLVKINTDYTYEGRTVEMNETAAKAMEAMFKELYGNGFKKMHITSGYRTYEYQVKLYNTYVNNEIDNAKKQGKTISRAQAEAIVDTYSAKAGTSEHQSGLCADMHNLSSANVKFAKEKEYEWLCQNAWKFGFILRFPETKEEITGYGFEPWHFRFVGRYHAYKIWSQGLCLEEYLQTLQQ